MSRKPPVSLLCDPPHVVRVIVPWIEFEGLLDTAFEQIRHYAASDMAVSLRLLRALDDIASTCHDAGIIAPLSGAAGASSPAFSTARARTRSSSCGERLGTLEARMDPFGAAGVREGTLRTDA